MRRRTTARSAARSRCIGALALFAAGACGDASADATADAARRTVRVSFQPHLSWGPLMIAQAEGFFLDEGLDVQFVPALRTEESLVALVTGDIDVRPGPLTAGFLSAVAQRAPIRITAGMGNLDPAGCTYYGIVLRRGLDTTGTPVIERIRASQDGASRFVVHKMLAMRNVRLKDIETIRLPEAVTANALATGAVDASASSEPVLSRVAELGQRWVSGQEAAPDFQWGVLGFGERLLTRDRDTGERFMRAFRRGVATFREGKTARNVAIIAEATGETPEGTRAACWPSFRTDARINWASIAEFQVWARSEGLMDRSVSQDQAWDSTFVVASDSTSPTRKQ